MHKILLRESKEVKGVPGNWKVIYKERPLYVITDSTHNRMRIIAPILERKDLKAEDLEILLEANFDRALDAKYSLFQDILWSTYTHPLGELTVEQFKDALRQVVRLADNYGTSYTSTDMVFGGDQ